MPLFFEDLRDLGKRIYFRAFIKDFTENFSPEWSDERYYGRVEPISIYAGTTRSANMTFDVVAWSPKDFDVMYKKVQRLQSMVYPSYDNRGFYKAGPLIKVRLGDLLCGENKDGMPAKIDNLDFSYDESVWNIESDKKAPRLITISLSLTVFHEANPGLYKDKDGDYSFGTATVSTDTNGNPSLSKISQGNIRAIFGQVRNIK